SGVPQRLGRSRLGVHVTAGVSEAELPDLVLRHRLAALLETSEVEVGVRVGRVLAYAKVGWNELTRPLVAAEADALASFAARPDPPRTFKVSRLLHALEWQGNTVTVVEPLVGGAPVSAFDPPRDATHELALGGIVTRSTLT